MTPLPILLGAGIGAIMGLTGAGGGVLAVPALVFFVGLPFAEAGPAALVSVAIAGAIGSAEALKRGLVRYRAAAFMAFFGVLLAPTGLRVARVSPERWLLAAFAVVLLIVAARMLARAGDDRATASRDVPCRMDPATGRLHWTPRAAATLGAIGATAGFLTGLLGVGGGFMIVPALRRFTDITMQGVVATSLAVTTLVATGTVATTVVHGHPPPWGVAAPFAAGAVGGMVAGRLLVRRLKAAHLQRIFGALAAVTAVAVAFRAFQGA